MFSSIELFTYSYLEHSFLTTGLFEKCKIKIDKIPIEIPAYKVFVIPKCCNENPVNK
jgi:hypothetical protein